MDDARDAPETPDSTANRDDAKAARDASMKDTHFMPP